MIIYPQRFRVSHDTENVHDGVLVKTPKSCGGVSARTLEGREIKSRLSHNKYSKSGAPCLIDRGWIGRGFPTAVASPPGEQTSHTQVGQLWELHFDSTF